MDISVNPYPSGNYAMLAAATEFSALLETSMQAEPAASIAPAATGESDPLTHGTAAPASTTAMQVISQLTQGGRDGVTSSGPASASEGAVRGASRGVSLYDGVEGATSAANAPAEANEAAVGGTPPAVPGNSAFSGRLAAASSNNPIASIKALAGLAEELRNSARAGGASIDPVGPATVSIDASSDSEAGKTYAVLQKLAQDTDRYIASAAKSLLSRITGVFSNGIIEYQVKGSSQGSWGAATGKIARALNGFADGQVLRLAHDMTDGRASSTERSYISNVLRAIETGTAVVIPTNSMPLSSQPIRGSIGLYKVAMPPNSAFLEDGAYVAIFPNSDGQAPRWT
jgi:hypothetical protein